LLRWIRTIVVVALAVATFYGLQFPHGPLPPLGPFLNPSSGFWRNGETLGRLPDTIRIDGLEGPVDVVWDDRGVPHLFASSRHDLYLAQGYLTARDRLWQMDFQTRAAGGLLSEVVGPAALDYDRHQRRLGMLVSAERDVVWMEEDPDLQGALVSYAAGVNAWIDGLDAATLPVEYKILNFDPEPWTPLRTFLLLKSMTWTLTGNSRDLARTRAREILEEAALDRLYPLFSPFLDPVIPAGTPWSFRPIAARSAAPERTVRVPPGTLRRSSSMDAEGSIGSNNWAVSGERTASGYPILANDPHLPLALPSLWYEIQLSKPDSNAYGVSLPGAPGVILGFNEHIAWGSTNSEVDVLDWYRIELRDESGTEYLHAGEWRPTTSRMEEIRVRGGETVREEVLYTHHGPLVYREGESPWDSRVPAGAALRWIGHDPPRSLSTFLLLNDGRGYDDYVEAMNHYDYPAQNFAFASAEGDIAIWNNGHYPLRREGGGRTIADGQEPAQEWGAWIPRGHLPQVRNPERGYVSSANQNPADRTYPYYLPGTFFSNSRGTRINERLEEMEAVTPEEMMNLQLDVLNLLARRVLPTILDRLAGADLSGAEARSRELLEGWDYRNDAGALAPALFDAWWREHTRLLWGDLGWEEGGFRMPVRDVTADAVLRPGEYPGAAGPPEELAVESFRAAHRSMTERHGEPGPAWEWGRIRGTDLRHLARIPGFDRSGLLTGGAPGIINATSRSFGPSWRMVVALGPRVRAWGIYPGGQSGNPGSSQYDAFVDDWVAGRFYELLYLRSADEEDPRVASRSRLEGGS
jgi:penicillin G amidase